MINLAIIIRLYILNIISFPSYYIFQNTPFLFVYSIHHMHIFSQNPGNPEIRISINNYLEDHVSWKSLAKRE